MTGGHCCLSELAIRSKSGAVTFNCSTFQPFILAPHGGALVSSDSRSPSFASEIKSSSPAQGLSYRICSAEAEKILLTRPSLPIASTPITYTQPSPLSIKPETPRGDPPSEQTTKQDRNAYRTNRLCFRPIEASDMGFTSSRRMRRNLKRTRNGPCPLFRRFPTLLQRIRCFLQALSTSPTNRNIGLFQLQNLPCLKPVWHKFFEPSPCRPSFFVARLPFLFSFRLEYDPELQKFVYFFLANSPL